MLAQRLMVILFLCISTAVAAEKPASRESVEELIELTGSSQMVDAMYGQVGQMFEGLGESMGLTQTERPAFDRYMQKVAALLQEDMSWEKMKAPMIDIYVRNFTEREVQGLITFYRSDIGRSMVAKMPVVMQESMGISQNMLHDTMPKVQALAEGLQSEIAALREARAE
jgi:uncharacterized protein